MIYKYKNTPTQITKSQYLYNDNIVWQGGHIYTEIHTYIDWHLNSKFHGLQNKFYTSRKASL